eukprot:711040-Pyramimonas_sp.AAC.1
MVTPGGGHALQRKTNTEGMTGDKYQDYVRSLGDMLKYWRVRGACVEFAWSLRGVCVEFAWSARGICMKPPRRARASSPNDARTCRDGPMEIARRC